MNLYSPLPLEKDALEDICILSTGLHLFSGKEIVSQGLLEDRRHFHCGSYRASLLCIPLSQHNWPVCLKRSQGCLGASLWGSCPVPNTHLSLNQLLTDIGVGVNNGLQLYVFNLMGMFTC